ncbi:MAG: ricin-type beta-trefoil lectin domain protein [Crocosphaera sp.]|nr:ricin-type beta-trefoil lectin domain protein [Crocosphaera sp.]
MKNCSLNFHGNNSYIQINNPPKLTDSMTISCWVKSQTTNWDRDAMLLCKRNSYMIATNKGSKIIRFYIYSDGWQYAFSNLDIDITQWHHYVGTFDGEAIRFYIDGEEVNCTYFQGQIHEDNNLLYIGHDPLRKTYFKGQITEIYIWDKAKNETEIRSDITSNFTAQDSNLVGYYPLNDGTKIIMEDVEIFKANWVKDYPKQLFKTTKIQTYFIQNLDSQLFLDIPGGKPNQAQIIWGYAYNGSFGQQWIITPSGVIKSILGEFALDLREIPDFPWAKEVTINTINGALSQQWEIDDNGVIKNKSNQFALTMISKNDYYIAMAYPIDESQPKANEKWLIVPH